MIAQAGSYVFNQLFRNSPKGMVPPLASLSTRNLGMALWAASVCILAERQFQPLI